MLLTFIALVCIAPAAKADPVVEQDVVAQSPTPSNVTVPSLVQIDHVVALSDAWQKGAQQWDAAKRATSPTT